MTRLIALLLLAAGLPCAAAPRTALLLDGVWRIAEGRGDAVPTAFDRTVAVPGLVTLARPAFGAPPGPPVANRSQFAQKDPARDAFWLKRTFRLDRPRPAVATLKVGKAMFGTRVWLNGQDLGVHLPCFTPGLFDAGAALRQGENELLIRIGADRDAVGPAIPSGFDYEKQRYIPGIFDSVQLILSGTPHIVSLQTAPDLPSRAVRVQVELQGAATGVGATVRFAVREVRSGRFAGRAEVRAATGAGRTTVDVRIPIAGCRLWSPEDPFLYRLEADTGADRASVRFGMRSFGFDPATGRALLNGRPYILRGSNFTLYRFFEDPQCGDLPWRSSWVRRLHERMKGMHWNSLRYCIGLAPEAWYDAADEVGLLIQNEFPVWHGGPGWGTWPPELKAAQLVTEFTEWLRESWNHPSVAIWDACNETLSPETGAAIRQVRGLDLSNRPWDNGYSAPDRRDDVYESHPYHFHPGFRFSELARADRIPQGNTQPNDGTRCAIINEYGWHWLNRDGSPTTLTQDIYRAALGEKATPAQRFRMQALWLAADTLFWRANRTAAGVLHFTALGYSRPDGQTCDHWMDVPSLRWEPRFAEWMRDAFAPVAPAIRFYGDRMLAGTGTRVPVCVINDLESEWRGRVTLRLRRATGGTALWGMTRDLSVEGLGTMSADFEVKWPRVPGRYLLEAGITGADRLPVRTGIEFDVVDRSALGLAFGKSVTVSSTYPGDYAKEHAVDGDPGTYWSSDFADPAWLCVDLGRMESVGRVRIAWETAYSTHYVIETSTDGERWERGAEERSGRGAVTEHRFGPAQARYVRLRFLARGTQWGHAVRELEVFGR